MNQLYIVLVRLGYVRYEFLKSRMEQKLMSYENKILRVGIKEIPDGLSSFEYN